MNDIKLWERQASFNDETVKFAEETNQQLKLLTWGIIATGVAVLLLTVGIILK
jgi:hypothetical protein